MSKAQQVKNERRFIKKQFKQWSIDVRNRDDNKCVICNKTKFLNAHHLIPRENKNFRFDLDNGISLCAGHHKFSNEISPHRNPITFVLWMQKNKKKQLNKLMKKYDEQ